MSGRARGFVGVVGLVGVVAVAAATTYATVGLFDDTSENQSLNRPSLGLCVDSLTPSAGTEAPLGVVEGEQQIESDAKSALDATLLELSQTEPLWESAGLSKEPWVIDIGCSSLPLPLAFEGEWINGYEPRTERPPTVASASPYKVFVFVLPSEFEIEAMLGGGTRRVVSQEFVCTNLYGEGCTIVEVTKAVYLTESDVNEGAATIAPLLADAVGFRD